MHGFSCCCRLPHLCRRLAAAACACTDARQTAEALWGTSPQSQKLTEEEAAAQQQQLRHTQSGASAWNAGAVQEGRPSTLVAVAWTEAR